MVSILYQVWLVYLGAFIPLFLMDYWNTEQVSHILWFDILFPIVPAFLYMLYAILTIKKIKESPTKC